MRVVARLIVAAIIAVGAATGSSTSAGAQDRIALVIGNGVYQHHRQLLNTDDDARLMDVSLTALGFDVELLIDVGRADMEAGFLRLNERLKAAGPDAVGVFYFAGHGVQSNGLNYLMPVDSSARVEPEVWSQAPRLGLLMDYLTDAGNATNFIILDACRDNPLPAAGRSMDGGLASAGRTRGTLIAYATAPGFTASDGPGQPNSPYTTALARLLPTPGWTAETLFKRVAGEVEVATTRLGVPEQSPWYENGLRGADFCFGGCAPSQTSTTAELERLRAENRRLVGLGAGAVSEVIDRSASDLDVSTIVPPVTTGSRATRRAGAEFRDCAACPQMVVIPAGSFVMGSPESEAGRDGDEDRKRTVRISVFAVGKFEVIWAEWEACVRGGGCDASGPEGRGGDEGWGVGIRPMINVNWNDAQAYVRWLNGQVTGSPYRLLTEAEWEYAARGETTGRFSWGSEDPQCSGLAPNGANYRACSDDQTHSVGRYAANPFGLQDMHGNVWEWVEDCYRNSYAGAPMGGLAVIGVRCERRVLRGGSWVNNPSHLRSASRGGYRPTIRNDNVGFRIARTL